MAAAEDTPRNEAAFPRSYQDERYQRGFLGAVGDLQKAGVLQDVVLEVEHRRFPCHRLVLSAASPYFRAMFTGKMAESRQKSVVLQGLDAAMFQEILSYIYSGTLHVSQDKVQPLYQAADLLQVDYVRETCSTYMAMNVECSTCLDLFMFADVFSLEIVRKRCLQCICRYFEKVSTTAEFCSLSVDQLTDIISQDELDVKEETTVWKAVVRWVEHSREDRQPHLPSILPHIRFNLLTSEDTAAILEHPLVREDAGSSQVIRKVVQRPTSKLRFGMTQEMVVLISESGDEIFCMNPKQGHYIRCPVKGTSNVHFDIQAMTVTSNNDIYILAGKSCAQLYLLVYNHLENKWEHQSSLPKADAGLAENCLVEVGGHLYHLAFFSPRDEDEFVLLRKYDKRTDQWLERSRLLPKKRVGNFTDPCKAVACGGQIYFMKEREWHRYHPSDDQWYEMPLPEEYMYPHNIRTAVVSETDIFCEGENLHDMFMYDTKSDTWYDLPSTPEIATFNYLHSRLFVWEGQLYVINCWYYSSEPLHDKIDKMQICVLDDSSEGIWTDLKVTLPDDWMENLSGDFDEFPCVARMYLPSLNASVAN